jgi:hypothetical protein
MEDQKLKRKFIHGNTMDIAVDENHAVAATAHILTTGPVEDRFIITSDKPPTFGCPIGQPTEPKLRDLKSVSVQHQVGVVYDDGSVRTSKNQALIS